MSDRVSKGRGPWVSVTDAGWAVGFEGDMVDDFPYFPRYHGPTAQVYYDDTWLFIETDSDEGCAMMRIETLPLLRRVLATIAKQRRDVARA